MRERAAVTLLAAALLSAAGAVAQTRPELTGPTQADMNRQAATRARQADEALNAAYRALMAQASPDGRRRLRAAQRAWVRFRDLDCAARAGSRGGSFYPASRSLCLEALAGERSRTLKAELDCAEGDMSCGGLRN